MNTSSVALKKSVILGQALNTMSRRQPIHLIVAAVTLLIAGAAFAQNAPTLIPFQGRLTNQAGLAYDNGQYTLTFNLYSVAVGGSTAWTERHEKVGVVNGMVNVFLGSINSFPAFVPLSNPQVPLFVGTKYLGITIDADANPATADPEMVPRTMLVPAFHAQNSTQLAGYDWSAILVGGNNPQTGSINGAKLGTGTITNLQIQDGGITTNDLGDAQVTGAKLAPGAADSAISDESITSQKIKDGEVKTSDIGDGSITASKITSGAIVDQHFIQDSVPARLLSRDIAVYSQVEAANIGGGLPSSNWQVRPLNRTEAQTMLVGSSISRNANRITLQPGTYFISAFASAFRASTHQIAFRDVTGSPPNPPVVVRGHSVFNHYSTPTYSESSTQSMLQGMIVVASSARDFQLFHYLNGWSAAWGGSFTMGYPVGGNDPAANENVYAHVFIERIK